MVDFGRSDDPRVQAQLDRLSQLSVPQGRFGLETITALMERLGNPHRKLPPVFHVAGTNGKGSTCAFLRAMLEADGKRVHVTTSPHLVRYNERIRLAGELISDAALADLLAEVLDASEQGDEDLGPSFFEVTIAAAFLAFSREPADACVVEVGLGGRLDATNVLEPEALAACGIAALGLDHEAFLLRPEQGTPEEPMARIAFEKAGIAKRGVPLVTLENAYPPEAQSSILALAKREGAHLHDQFLNFYISAGRPYYHTNYYDETPLLPALAGEHQALNLGLAITMLLSQDKIAIGDEAIKRGARTTRWPARMQRLEEGPLTVLSSNRPVWLDGGHNPNAGAALAESLVGRVHLVLGMLANKNPDALTGAFAGRIASLSIVPVPGHNSHRAHAFGDQAVARADLKEALLNLPNDGLPVLIAGSLYLAGEALRLNDEVPE